jgi:hypothetical protein
MKSMLALASVGLLTDYAGALEDSPNRSIVSKMHVGRRYNVGLDELGTVEATAIDSASPWLLNSLQTLAKLRSLETRWEISGASPPNQIALRLAATVLAHLSEIDFQPDRIAPSTDEGVCISFQRSGRYADIESFNTGEILAVIAEAGDEPVIWELNATEIDEAVAKINGFIFGKKK